MNGTCLTVAQKLGISFLSLTKEGNNCLPSSSGRFAGSMSNWPKSDFLICSSYPSPNLPGDNHQWLTISPDRALMLKDSPAPWFSNQPTNQATDPPHQLEAASLMGTYDREISSCDFWALGWLTVLNRVDRRHQWHGRRLVRTFVRRYSRPTEAAKHNQLRIRRIVFTSSFMTGLTKKPFNRPIKCHHLLPWLWCHQSDPSR